MSVKSVEKPVQNTEVLTVSNKLTEENQNSFKENHNTLKRKYAEDVSFDISSVPKFIDSQEIIFKAAKEPAYKRYSPLLVKVSSKFTLPKSFHDLFKLFTSLESVINYLKSRATVAIFHKIQKSVELQSGL